MDQYTWDQFRESVDYVLLDHGVEVYFEGVGTGFYEGRTEESYTVVGRWTDAFDKRLSLLDRMGVLAGQFQQDSAAVTFGQTMLTTSTIS
jgi:hypothetical protein